MKPGALLCEQHVQYSTRGAAHSAERNHGVLSACTFSIPSPMLPLVEVIRCEDTEPATRSISGSRLRQGSISTSCRSNVPVRAGISSSIVSWRPTWRKRCTWRRKACRCAKSTGRPSAFGMPMGPVELVDSVGLDVALHVSKVLGAHMNRPVPERLVEDGRGDGSARQESRDRAFMPGSDGKADQTPPSDGGPGTRGYRGSADTPMVNEAVACLSEGVVSGCRSARCRRDIWHRICALSRRTAELRA